MGAENLAIKLSTPPIKDLMLQFSNFNSFDSILFVLISYFGLMGGVTVYSCSLTLTGKHLS